MKITAFDDLYPMQLGTGSTTLYGATGSNSGITGGDVTGEPGWLSVVGLRNQVSIQSNITPASIGDVLTIVQTSPTYQARFATSSNAASTGSNAVTRTLGGQETIVTHAASGSARVLDLGGGNVFDVTLNASPVVLSFTGEPSGVAAGITLLLRQDGSGGRTVTWPGEVVWPNAITPTLATAASAVDVFAMFTLDTGTTWFGFPTGAGVSYGSNSMHVAETSFAGAAIPAARYDHRHAGVAQVTSSSSNTLQRGTFNLRPGTGSALTVTDTDGDGEFDTVFIHSSGSGGGGGSSVTELLGYVADTSGDQSITSATLADLPTNIAVTFTAPASGNVLVRLSATAGATVTANAYQSWGLRESTTNIAGAVGESIAVRHMTSTSEGYIGASKTFVLTGISAGSHTYKWAAACSTSGGTLKANTNSPAVMEVWSLP